MNDFASQNITKTTTSIQDKNEPKNEWINSFYSSNLSSTYSNENLYQISHILPPSIIPPLPPGLYSPPTSPSLDSLPSRVSSASDEDVEIETWLRLHAPSSEMIQVLMKTSENSGCCCSSYNHEVCVSGCFQLASYIPRPPRLKRCGIICVKNIFNVPHLLVVRGKKSKIWSLPKGCINEGETEAHCAQRETFEETGLHLDIYTDTPRININHNIYFVIPISFNPKLKIRDRAEIDKVNWLTLDEIRLLECNKDLRSILQYPQRKFNFHSSLVQLLKMDEVHI